MEENPYEPPGLTDEPTDPSSVSRRQSRRRFRAAAIVLLLPAVYNYWEFDASVISRYSDDLALFQRSANMIGIAIGWLLIWFLGFPCLEFVSRVIHHVFARRTNLSNWQEALYRSLIRVPCLAVAGAMLWIIWVIGFYRTEADFYVLSWAIGVPAHLLAACWYLPLMYYWYRQAAS